MLVKRQTVAALMLAASAASTAIACPTPQEGKGVEIYPTAATLPANLLRFFVYFPGPMDPNEILSHIVLIDSNGHEVEGAFLNNRYDLWSPNRTRLTILLHPGRVKTGLVAHDAMGRALETGKSYTLYVRATADDAQGCALGTDTLYMFVAGEADLDPPAPADWVLLPRCSDHTCH